MTDTPILNSFLPALARGIRSAPPLDRVISGPISRPIIAYEVECNAIHLMTGKGDNLARTGVPSLWAADRDRLLAHADRVPASVCLLLAFRAETTRTVAAFHNNGKGLIGIDPYCKFDGDAEWVGWGSMFAAHSDPAIDGWPMVFDYYPDLRSRVRDDEPLIVIGQLFAWHAMTVLNEYFDRLANHETNPVYRMSTSGTHKLYNKARPKKAGIIASPVRVIDLSKPKVEMIPVGPSTPTGRVMPAHWRGPGVRTFRDERYVNMRGKTVPTKGYGVHGALPPDTVVTVLKGLSA